MRLDAASEESERAGTLIGLAPVRAQLVPADLWCRFELAVRDEPGGVRVQSFLNGLKVADALDSSRRCSAGDLRFAGPKGGKLELRNVRLERSPGR